MAKEQSNTSFSDDTIQIVHEVATLSVASSSTAARVENLSVSDESADSALSSAQSSAKEMMNLASTSPVQSTSARPLFKTREGRIAAFKRALGRDTVPGNRVNLKALIRYYEDGGKVPEGDEEVWAVDGEVSFGIRKYTSFDQMPEGWLFKTKYLDVSGYLWPRLFSRFLSFILLRSHC